MTEASISPLAKLWTDEQESSLLKAAIKFKPVGIHKHFRMLAIREYMLNHGIINPDDRHTSTPGLWEKLGSLYDLSELDLREDSTNISNGDEHSDGTSYWRDFELPRDDYEALMWEKRLAPDGSVSPEWSRRESTIPDTDEPRSSPMSGRGSARGVRAMGRRGRLSKLQNELEPEKGSRRNSKAPSTTDDDHTVGDAEDEDEAHASEDDEDDEAEDNEVEEKKESGRRGGRGGRRARGRRGRRRGG